MTPENLNQGYRYQSLDVLRGVASLAVVIFHYRHFFYAPGVFVAETPQFPFVLGDLPFSGLIGGLYLDGWKAVQLFFVLSGFIFFAIYHRKVNDGTVGGKKFVLLRFSRLYPLHFLTLVIVAVLQLLSLKQSGEFLLYRNNDLRHFILNLFMATDWGLKAGESFNDPIWSVSIEILLYAAFYGLSRLMKFSLSRSVIVAALALGIWFLDYNISTGLVCFFAGGGMYFLNEIFMREIRSPGRRVTASFAILACGLLLYNIVPDGHFLSNRLLYFVVYPGVVLSLATLDRSYELRLQWIRWIGDITYSAYLLHVPVQISVLLVLGRAEVTPDFYNPVVMLGYLVLVIALSIASYRFFEMPMQSAVRKWGLKARG